ncbi:MAG: hypothetical protein ABSH51_25845 [Solirubrobacteraceae bacterium]|jgi:hypothetical protein
MTSVSVADPDLRLAYRACRRMHRARRSCLVPALPPRLLTAGLRLMARRRLTDRSFGWYLDQAHPSFAANGETARARPWGRPRSPRPDGVHFASPFGGHREE